MQQLIVISGPTACKKTDTAINLAKKINGEIISADSMQVYKYMDIGTAKLNDDKNIKHYLIDVLDPDEEFSVKVFKDMATKAIKDIVSKGKIPIVVGGTAFYINALIFDVEFDNNNKHCDLQYSHEYLQSIDKEAAMAIHPNNIKRISRAVNYYKQTGKLFSKYNQEQSNKKYSYNTSFFILNMERKTLYNNINTRVDTMINNGLVNEVQFLLNKGYTKDLVSMQGIGYKEIIKYLDKELDIDKAIEDIKKNTRHFAKRQLTWFKNKVDNAIWLNIDELNNEDIITEIIKRL